MTVTEQPAAEIGRDRRRKEDQRLITGRTRWTDNLTLPGMLHMSMVRSPFAHAKLSLIDTSQPKAAPTVAAVITGMHIAEEQGRLPHAQPRTTAQVTPAHPPLPADRATFPPP